MSDVETTPARGTPGLATVGNSAQTLGRKHETDTRMIHHPDMTLTYGSWPERIRERFGMWLIDLGLYPRSTLQDCDVWSPWP